MIMDKLVCPMFFLVYERVKKSTTSQEEVNETLIKFGDILRVKKDDSFF